jgi:hypothetical protein
LHSLSLPLSVVRFSRDEPFHLAAKRYGTHRATIFAPYANSFVANKLKSNGSLRITSDWLGLMRSVVKSQQRMTRGAALFQLEFCRWFGQIE